MSESKTVEEANFCESIKDDKRWIKTGSEVIHRDHPGRKMYVDQVVKTSKEIAGRRKTFVIGVDCHWINDTGDYSKGRFLTMELRPWQK
jgi:hypothetical protein